LSVIQTISILAVVDYTGEKRLSRPFNQTLDLSCMQREE
jgi:hypothetical protein